MKKKDMYVFIWIIHMWMYLPELSIIYMHIHAYICLYVCTYVLEDAENEDALKNKRKESWKAAKTLNRSESWGLFQIKKATKNSSV